jgi:hypothetical protein
MHREGIGFFDAHRSRPAYLKALAEIQIGTVRCFGAVILD